MNSNKVTCLFFIVITTQHVYGRSYYGNFNYGRDRDYDVRKYLSDQPRVGVIILESPGTEYYGSEDQIVKSHRRRSMINPSQGATYMRFWNRPGSNNQQGAQVYKAPGNWNNNQEWGGNNPSWNQGHWGNPGQQWNTNTPNSNSNNFGNWNQQYPDYYEQDTTTNRFPNGHFPVTNRPWFTSSPTTTSDAVQNCVRTCLVTSEYNPVCGTNNVTYSNPSRLECAKFCGVEVDTHRKAPCTARLPETTTQVPTFVPTWTPSRTTNNPVTDGNPDFNDFTTKPNRQTVSDDLLNSIFTSPPTPTPPPPEQDFDIDIRIKEKNGFPLNRNF